MSESENCMLILSIFRCICGTLKDKTRVLVTHQVQFLKKADLIVVMKDVSTVFLIENLINGEKT
jgi:ABC-type transport system involved in cytochrome bd biosynthesis fused ATPase/permease subunit